MVSETWLKYKLEKWFTQQCSYYSYSRLKSARISQVCKNFTLQRKASFDSKTSCPLISHGNCSARIVRSKTFTPGDFYEKESRANESEDLKNKCKFNKGNAPENYVQRGERRWKNIRLSFNKRTEEDRSKPVLPEVLKTKMSLEWSQARADETLKLTVDMVDFERRQREVFIELAMKRDQVEEFKRELDTANLKIHGLTRSLESAKNTIEEQEHTLNLALKNTRFLEDQLQTKRDFMSRTHLQQESAIQERKSLRELVQKTELQNYNLVRELNELKALHDCDVAYQKDLMNQNSIIRAKIAEITEAIQKMYIDQKGMTELTNKIEICEELQKTVCFYREEFYKSKREYMKLEEKFIVANAAIEKFKMLSTKNDDIFTIDQETGIIINQWKKATKWFDEQSKIQNDVIEGLTKSLQVEKEANLKICMHEAELDSLTQKLQEENTNLTVKLSQFLKETKSTAVQTDACVIAANEAKLIKTEFIEIFDDN